MPETIADILWWFLTVALGIIVVFGKYIWGNRDQELKEIKEELKKISISTASIPTMADDIRTHTQQINAINIVNASLTTRMIILENDKAKN